MTPEIIPFTTEDGSVFYVEMSRPPEPAAEKIKRGNKLTEKMTESWETIREKAPVVFEKSMVPLKGIVGVVMTQLKEIKESPEQVTLEMGIKLAAEAGIVLTQVGGEAHFKLTITWKDEAKAPQKPA